MDSSQYFSWLKQFGTIQYGEIDRFLSQLSLKKMPLSHEEVLKVLTSFKANRFRPSASKTIIENHRKCFEDNEFKFMHVFKEKYPERELTKERVDAERKVRKELKRRFVWVFRRGNEWKVYKWKNKPVSDWLKDIGFAVTLMPFDTRAGNVLKELQIRVTEENYEDVEDFFIKQVCPMLGILPSQVDKILYEKHDQIISLLRDNLQ